MTTYVTPNDWTTGDVITAALLNQNRDNVKFLHDPPTCRVYTSSATTIPNTTATAVTFDAERWDTDTMHSTGSNTSRITATTAGLYIVGGCIDWVANTTGRRRTEVLLLGTTIIAQEETPPTSTGESSHTVVTSYRLNAGDYVELRAYQSSGGNLDINAGHNSSCEFWACWVSG